MPQGQHQLSHLLLHGQGEFAVTMGQLCSALEQQRVKEMFGSGTACMICPLSQIVYKGEVRDTLLPLLYVRRAPSPSCYCKKWTTWYCVWWCPSEAEPAWSERKLSAVVTDHKGNRGYSGWWLRRCLGGYRHRPLQQSPVGKQRILLNHAFVCGFRVENSAAHVAKRARLNQQRHHTQTLELVI